MSTYKFILTADKKPVGNIEWYCGGDDGGGNLSGDTQAVKLLEQAALRGAAEGWEGKYPPPTRVWVAEPLNYIWEMITVLEHAGFDVPSVLVPFTAQAMADQMAADMAAEIAESDAPDEVRAMYESFRY